MPSLRGLNADENRKRIEILVAMQMEENWLRHRPHRDIPTTNFHEVGAFHVPHVARRHEEKAAEAGAANATATGTETESKELECRTGTREQAPKVKAWEAIANGGYPLKARSDGKPRPQTGQALWGLPQTSTTKPPISQAINALLSLNPAAANPSIRHNPTPKAIEDVNENEDFEMVDVSEEEGFEKIEKEQAEIGDWEEI